MKRLLMYLIVVVVALFIGFTTYYAIQNKESIQLVGVTAGGIIRINKGETFDLPIEHKDPYKTTTLEITYSDTSILSYNEENKTFYGEKGGVTTIVITPSNENFGPFSFDVYVGDGLTEDYPLYIKTAEDLKNVSTTQTMHYQLMNDIDLKSIDNGVWTPLSSFKGTLTGNGNKILNMNVTAQNDKAGLFENLEATAKVQNIVFDNAQINGSYEYAGIVAGTSAGFIGKCSIVNSGITNTLNSSHTGGVVGKIMYNATKATVEMCETIDLIINSTGYAGGIAGEVDAGIIFNSSAISTFEGNGNFAGIVYSVQSRKFESDERISVVKNTLSQFNAINLGVSSKLYGIIAQNTALTKQDNAYLNNYYSSLQILSGVTGLHETVKDDQFKLLTDAELKVQENYKNWEFDDVWLLEDGDAYAHLDFNAYFRKCGVYEYSQTITKESDFKSAMDLIRKEGTGEFVVEGDMTVDYENNEFEMIPKFDGEIRCENGTLTIKNIKIVSNSSMISFIGEFSGILQNITFENITIDTSNRQLDDTYAGAFTAINNGTIDNCDVSGININFKGTYLGGIAGSNKSIIKNCDINNQTIYEESQTKLFINNLNGILGGIAGENAGTIQDCNVGTLELSVSSASGIRKIGGIAGENGKIIKDSTVIGAQILTNSTSSVYAGGLVGENLAQSQISKCYASCEISINEVDSQSKAGGFTAINRAGATIYGCASECIISATNIGGLVETNFGRVEQSYAQGGRLKGVNVGGLSNIADSGSEITNCYSTQTLEGSADGSVVAGITVELKKGSDINHCFTAVSFTGLGTRFAESQSEFRFPLTENVFDYPRVLINGLLVKINQRKEVGTLTNCGITNYGDAKIQYRSSIFKGTDSTFLSLTDDDFMQGNYQGMFADHGFDPSIWKGISGTVIVEGEPTASSYYPTLTNAYQIVVD